MKDIKIWIDRGEKELSNGIYTSIFWFFSNIAIPRNLSLSVSYMTSYVEMHSRDQLRTETFSKKAKNVSSTWVHDKLEVVQSNFFPKCCFVPPSSRTKMHCHVHNGWLTARNVIPLTLQQNWDGCPLQSKMLHIFPTSRLFLKNL